MSTYLCEDLIVEIFTRLPPKSLLRFRSLSKSLCSRISDPDFIRNHTLRSPRKILFRHKSKRKEHGEDFYTLHSENQLPLCPRSAYNDITAVKFLYRNFSIVGSCNGILCLFNHAIGIRLWNPSIRHELTLPKHPSLNYERGRAVLIGFGFDKISNDYKIVMISYKLKQGIQDSFVYSSKTGFWCKIASDPGSPFSYVRSLGCFANGALHWVVEHHTNIGVKVCQDYILTFDLSTHSFGAITLRETNQRINGLTIINGSLAVTSINENNLIIWSRREYNNAPRWYVHYSFNKNLFGAGKLVQIKADGNLVFKSLYEGYQVNPLTLLRSKLVEYNDSSFKVNMEMFVESLELLDTAGSVCKGDQSFSLEAETEKQNKNTTNQVAHTQLLQHGCGVLLLFSFWFLQFRISRYM